MTFIKQLRVLLRMSLLSVPEQLGPVLTIVLGVTCAVGVLVSMLAMGVGAQRQNMADVNDSRAVLQSIGAQGPLQSDIPQDAVALIRQLPGIRRNSNHEPIAVPIAVIFTGARKKIGGTRVDFPLVGVSPGYTELTPEFHITAGRMLQPGLSELVVNNQCARQYVGFEIGDKRPVHGADWTIVGRFDQGHGQTQCVVYADADSVISAFGRGSYNQVNVMLESPAAFADLAGALKANPTLRLEAKHEREVVEDRNRQLNGILNFVSYFVGAIMAMAATLGAVNSLYALVDSRRRVLATLRAIGFGSGAVVVATLAESILLAVPGALLGGLAAWLFFNGLSASPMGITFQLAVTPSLLVMGAVWALAMGLLGGLLPALRAARVPVTAALRAT